MATGLSAVRGVSGCVVGVAVALAPVIACAQAEPAVAESYGGPPF